MTARLLAHYGIKKPMIAYNDSDESRVGQKVIRMLEEGKVIAFVSDAGTPLVSDPGYKLVREVVNKGYYVTAIPGATASITALLLSGMPSDRFLFIGFLPTSAGARKKSLQEISDVKATVIIFERADRLIKTISAIKDIMGNRNIATARELTKMFEEVKRGTTEELLEYYEQEGTPKGEVVLLIESGNNKEVGEEDIIAILKDKMKDTSLSKAVAEVSAELNMPRKKIYNYALSIKNKE